MLIKSSSGMLSDVLHESPVTLRMHSVRIFLLRKCGFFVSSNQKDYLFGTSICVRSASCGAGYNIVLSRSPSRGAGYSIFPRNRRER